MSIKTKVAAVALVALTATGMVAGSTQHADAKGLGLGIAAGVIGAAAVGSAIAADGYYYDGYRRCGWVPRYNAYGDYIGRVRTCY